MHLYLVYNLHQSNRICDIQLHMWHLHQNILYPSVVRDNLIGQDMVIRMKLFSINDIPAGQSLLVPKAIGQPSRLQLPSPDYVNLSRPIGLSFSFLHACKSVLFILANRLSGPSPKQSSVLFKLCSSLMCIRDETVDTGIRAYFTVKPHEIAHVHPLLLKKKIGSSQWFNVIRGSLGT